MQSYCWNYTFLRRDPGATEFFMLKAFPVESNDQLKSTNLTFNYPYQKLISIPKYSQDPFDEAL